MKSIHPFIYKKVVVLNEDTPAQDAAKAIRENAIGCVLVSNSKNQLVGIVTDRDFANRLAADYAVTSISLSEIMTSDLVVATSDARVVDIVHLMEKHGIRRIPLVDSREEISPGLLRSANTKIAKCIGIVTLDDLIATKHIDLHQLARIVKRQVGRRIIKDKTNQRGLRSEQRSESRSDQVLQHFYQKVPHTKHLVEKEFHLLTSYLLGLVAKRLSFTGAAHFAAQLPKAIQEEILLLPAGPDRSITTAKIIGDLVTRFKFSEADAQDYLHSFYSNLDQLVDRGEVEHIKAQLPKDLLNLFAPIEEGQEHGKRKIA